jgi:hypothetical protein
MGRTRSGNGLAAEERAVKITGGPGWLARYFQEVDAGQKTRRFWQEVYDDQGRLVETHEKHPVVKGHQKV